MTGQLSGFTIHVKEVASVRESMHSLIHRERLLWEEMEGEHKHCLKTPPIIDFGKIIIYTNNLKIIRTPMEKRDFMKKILQKGEEADGESLMSKEEGYGDRDQNDGSLVEAEGALPPGRYTQDGELPEDNCFHCRGSGSATCSLCHGSKFSMLANRFKESYRALRCPACNENGLQPCQICNQ
ncbi:glutaredoxin domain-containing cysteine-rich protein 2 [Octodon degus]|uniref:Glutaredoxin domain-containing cysteine-rich protein 2 n=1 Tax=Octodon degus TaxID=10160 RepID=A0A6P6EFH3_OCTDE|nr:glutaredoxin domain-containing cysteine-rich protein 2 [Octodon degus]